ncbi:hypothetical protein HYFRA_00009685 [Hymenoscyphus fraxineus]|uniref:Acyltransferase 3 domain-containing protein n=1 Tax=Hymenoscyphus fraxineus TaxID=746836 RepID=A0A9N9PH40_9HELO|nr:hypothetical protein HYFRA_00009685 [Hymenoscyphus fraxineus]
MVQTNDRILDEEMWGGEKNQPRSSYLRSAVKGFIDVIRPAILVKGPRKQLMSTSYLDGLRGWAAFMVYWQHHQLWPRTLIFADQNFENGFGYQDRYYFGAFPGIRLFFSGGHFAVAIFFVISGYVLSAKPIKLMYAGEHEKLGQNLSSALFRRWIRLHIPVMGTTFAYMTSWHLFGIWTVTPAHERTFRDELWKWYCEMKNFTFVFRTGGESWLTYNFHAWSIPVEFRGSIIVYTALLAFSRCTRNARLWCQAGLMFYFMYIVDGWFGTMFVSGMFLCELDFLATQNNLPNWISNLSKYRVKGSYVLFFCAVYLGGCPSHGSDIQIIRDSPGWYWLSWFHPQANMDPKWLFLWTGAFMMMVAIPNLKWLKGFFETRFCQYLGHISFALYLTHGPVLWLLGDRLYTATGWHREANLIHTPYWVDAFPLSKAGPLGFDMAFWVPQIILLPFTLWMAEIVTKVFDEPSVKIAQWCYRKTLAPAPKM